MKTADRKQMLYLAALAVVLVAAASVRLINLGVPSLWVDEVNHVYAGQSLMNGEEPRFPSGNLNERALLYSWTVALSFKLLGVNEFAARLPSVIFGLLAIVATYFLAARLLGPQVGLLAAIFLAFSHNGIGWSRTCRMYTMFQFLYVAGVYFFYRGFEPDESSDPPSGDSWHRRLWREVKIGWLVAALVVFAVSFSVHQLTALFGVSFLAYCAVMAALSASDDQRKPVKYVFVTLAAVGAVIVGIAFFHLLDFIRFAVGFKPAWAKYNIVTDTHYYYWFLADSAKFPIAALFLIGAIQTVTRGSRPAFFILTQFAVPAFMLSFVFSYRVHNYIFHVYPFYLILAAFALVNIYRGEVGQALDRWRLPRFVPRSWARVGVFLIVFGWLPATVWFRYALKLPFIVPTGMNGAVDHLHWRGATDWLKQNAEPDAPIVSTLPLTVLYYYGRVSYNLNQANLDTTLDWQNQEQRVDYYSGVPAITSVAEMDSVLHKHATGYLVVDSYRFQRARYVPREIARFVEKKTKLIWKDERDTVRIYRWDRNSLDAK